MHPNRLLFSVVAAALALGACGDDPSPATSSDAASDAADATDATDAADADVAAPDSGNDAGDGSGDAATDADPDASLAPDVPIPPSGPAPEYLPVADPGPWRVEVVDTRTIVPSDGLPDEIPPNNSNNNLDVIRFDGRVWLAWRTAPDHFASSETRIFVVSSTDEVEWRFEAEFGVGTDLREPRFLVAGDRLHLYMAQLGTLALGFDPVGTLVTSRGDDGSWTEPVRTGPDTLIVWRARDIDGQGWVVGYTGGGNIYRFNGEPLDIYLFRTDDAVTLAPFDPMQPIVSTGGGSETDWALSPDGDLWAVIRNEAGDATGFGSKVCRASATSLAVWRCYTDPRKYDSPLMFWHGDAAWIIGRRNVTPDGHYDVFTEGDLAERAVRNELEYSSHPKRCALWRVDPATTQVRFVLDLPSAGDTCFASILPTDVDGEYVVYNYTSPIDSPPDLPWNEGQRGPTLIVRHLLRFTPDIR